METKKYDLVVIGAGVLGSFMAYNAAKKGLSVLLLERNLKPIGATIQNFGQVVPSGFGANWQRYGRESLDIYKAIQEEFDITVRQNGSLYIASDDEEQCLLEELLAINKINDYSSQLLSQKELFKRHPWIKPSYGKAGLFFPQEITVEPREMIGRLHTYIARKWKVDLAYNQNIVACEALSSGHVKVQSSSGSVYYAERAIVCNGAIFETLYPELFDQSGIQVSKLQMLKTKPIEKNQILGSILTGLTIRRYEAFEECPSFHTIKAKEPANSFERRYGIHILIKQAQDGGLILGDSHEYFSVKEFKSHLNETRECIDTFVMDKVADIIELKEPLEIESRWNGYYSQSTDSDLFTHKVSEEIHVVTAIGGKGMTASAGFTQEYINLLEHGSI
ncbi:MAG: TIGR03364 family FAD-dependent oxidoreductase [Bacteroidetes bacterium]|nr:TIGR03364 family FAD-dependent oxidoreductase [Bacteroidota bacterium]